MLECGGCEYSDDGPWQDPKWVKEPKWKKQGGAAKKSEAPKDAVDKEKAPTTQLHQQPAAQPAEATKAPV